MNNYFYDFGEDNYSEDYLDNISYTDVIRSVCEDASDYESSKIFW